jgi:hypothetical protein
MKKLGLWILNRKSGSSPNRVGDFGLEGAEFSAAVSITLEKLHWNPRVRSIINRP